MNAAGCSARHLTTSLSGSSDDDDLEDADYDSSGGDFGGGSDD